MLVNPSTLWLKADINAGRIMYAKNEEALTSVKASIDRLHRGTIPPGQKASGQGRSQNVTTKADIFKKYGRTSDVPKFNRRSSGRETRAEN